MSEKFDLIVVGAGPCGLSAALTAARLGLSVVLIERGDYPGSKNVMGGVIYRQPTEQVVPGFWQEAPLERRVVKSSLWILGDGSAVTLGLQSRRRGEEPYESFTVLRAKFDRWLAQKAIEAGVLMITETVVEDLLFEDQKVTGVRVGREVGEVKADLVILAEGVNSLLTRKAGMQIDIPAEQLATAVKEIIALPREKIEDRFGLDEGEGATIELVGEATRGLQGVGFIYTNRDSVSIGVGVILSDLAVKGVNPNELLEALKNHPQVRRLLAGGETKEYLAHLIPEGGYRAVPKLYRDGLMVAGDAAMLVNGLHREGSNMAMTSGRIAGEVAGLAKERGDFSIKTLAEYRRRLENSFILKDLRQFEGSTSFLHDHPQFFDLYPRLLNRAVESFLTVDGRPKREKQKEALAMITKERPSWKVALDLWKVWRTMG